MQLVHPNKVSIRDNTTSSFIVLLSWLAMQASCILQKLFHVATFMFSIQNCCSSEDKVIVLMLQLQIFALNTRAGRKVRSQM